MTGHSWARLSFMFTSTDVFVVQKLGLDLVRGILIQHYSRFITDLSIRFSPGAGKR